MKSNPTQIVKWLRTRKHGSSLPNRERAADLIEELQAAVIASQARIAELERLVAEHVEVDRQWDVQRVGRLCGVPLGGSIRQAVEPTLLRLTAKVAELERQAAIGRRAVEMLRDLQTVQTEVPGWSECPSCFCGSRRPHWGWHEPDCELAAILRDANGQGILDSSSPKPATVAVDAEALEALRSAMSKLRAPMSRTEYAVARAGIIEAACRLLAGGE